MVKYATLCCLLAAAIVLTGCQEETRVNTIQGVLYADCENPLPATEVAFKTNAEKSFSEAIILASAITDMNGFFQFTYELEEDKSGSADLIVVTPNTFYIAQSQIPLNEDHTFNAFLENRSPVFFTLAGNRNFQANDTLYYGLEGAKEDFIVQPTNGRKDTLFAELGNQFESSKWIAFYYGIGLNDFQIAREALSIQDSSYQHIYLEIEGCTDSEEAYLQLD